MDSVRCSSHNAFITFCKYIVINLLLYIIMIFVNCVSWCTKVMWDRPLQLRFFEKKNRKLFSVTLLPLQLLFSSNHTLYRSSQWQSIQTLYRSFQWQSIQTCVLKFEIIFSRSKYIESDYNRTVNGRKFGSGVVLHVAYFWLLIPQCNSWIVQCTFS